MSARKENMNENDHIDFEKMDYMFEVELLAAEEGLTSLEAMNIIDLLYPEGEPRE